MHYSMTILYQELVHLQILVSAGILEPILGFIPRDQSRESAVNNSGGM